MKSVRTPDCNFAELPGWDFEARYIDGLPGYEGLRLHYIDEGPRDGEVYLCLHGEPTWSYLYRKMIPIFTKAGKRVIAFDWFGFGRSDKPVDDDVYSFHFHRNTLLRFIEALELERLVLVCQDWGGILGLTLPADSPELITSLIVMNTDLAVGTDPTPGFLAWRDYVLHSPDFDVGRLMKRAVPKLSEAEIAAYDAPFPTAEYKAGVRMYPALVPVDEGMDGVQESQRSAQFWSEVWAGPTFMAIGMEDPVLGPKSMMRLRSMIRGCPPPLELPGVGHFVQEDGERVAREALAYFELS